MPESPVELSGRLVALRDWTPADLPELTRWLAPDQRWRDTDGPYFGRPTDREVAEQLDRRARLAGTPIADRPVPRTTLAVVALATNRLIGQVSWYWESERTDWRRMGIAIFDEQHWGGGFGTEALASWTDYLFTHTDALRLDFATFSGNPGMIAVGRKLGFVEEARFRQARRWAGGTHDSVVLGVLRDEWLSR